MILKILLNEYLLILFVPEGVDGFCDIICHPPKINNLNKIMIQKNERSIASTEDVRKYSQDSFGLRAKKNLEEAVRVFSERGHTKKRIDEIIEGNIKLNFTQNFIYPMPDDVKEFSERLSYQFDENDPDRSKKMTEHWKREIG